jgi:gliding motility-associated-like protein
VKKIGNILFILLVVSISSFGQIPNDLLQQPNINTTGQIVYYPFDGNTINQGSGNYTATVSGPTFSPGICGQGMHFDGIDDYIQISPYIDLSSNFTISAWIFVDSLTSNLAVFATRDQCSTTYRGYSQGEIGVNYYTVATGGSNRIRYVINTHQNCTGYSAGDRYYVPNYTYSSGSWHFLAISVQGNSTDNRIIKTYVDCQLYSMNQYYNYNTSAAFNPNNNNKSFIGAASSISPWIYSFNGTIDEFRLFNRVITDDEMKTLYYQCRPLNISINKFIGFCTGDSAVVELINTQAGVQYQLFDSTGQQNIGNPQVGGCNSLFFNTGLVSSYTDFYIKATSVNSGIQIVLDTMINLDPTSSSATYYDTLLVCENDSVQINGQYYSPPNIITDTFADALGCDSILQYNLLAIPLPIVDLGSDTSYCTGDSVEIKLNNSFSSVLWSTGETSNSIFVNSPGLYWVEINDGNCTNFDTIKVSDIASYYIEINDSSFCYGEKWIINLPNSNQYLWYNGSTNSYNTIIDSGLYWVEITDLCKEYTDSFSANVTDCNCLIVIPNVFTPNGDGLNDDFFAVINCELVTYQMFIYNRWGKLLFQSDNQYEVWDGKYLGEEVPDGVYFYLMKYGYMYPQKNEGIKTGSVTIYR